VAKASSTEVANIADSDIMSLEELNSLFGSDDNYVPDSYEDLDAYFEAQGGLIEFKGSPYDLVKDKSTLVDRPFAIVNIRFYKGTFGEACAVMAITQEGDKIVFNDGSSGIFSQCESMVKRVKRRGGFTCPNGLRASSYTYVPKDLDGNSLVGTKAPDGTIYEETPATTYYIG
jgi:hypothetical protein